MQDGSSVNPDGAGTSEGRWANFRRLLDEQTEWPTEYLYKFIVPKEQLDVLKAVFGDAELVVRASSKGKYMSVTSRLLAASADDVINVYEKAGEIEGVISL